MQTNAFLSVLTSPHLTILVTQEMRHPCEHYKWNRNLSGNSHEPCLQLRGPEDGVALLQQCQQTQGHGFRNCLVQRCMCVESSHVLVQHGQEPRSSLKAAEPACHCLPSASCKPPVHRGSRICQLPLVVLAWLTSLWCPQPQTWLFKVCCVPQQSGSCRTSYLGRAGSKCMRLYGVHLFLL